MSKVHQIPPLPGFWQDDANPAYPAPKNHNCKSGTFLRTAEEAKKLGFIPSFTLRTFGGQKIDVVGHDVADTQVRLPNGDIAWIYAGFVKHGSDHQFKDYGMKRSWCDHCGVPGHFDPSTGTYKE